MTIEWGGKVVPIHLNRGPTKTGNQRKGSYWVQDESKKPVGNMG